MRQHMNDRRLARAVLVGASGLLAVIVATCSPDRASGSGAVVAEARQAAPFSRIKVGYGIRVRQSGGLGRSVKRRRLLHVPGDRRLVDASRPARLPPSDAAACIEVAALRPDLPRHRVVDRSAAQV